MLESPHTHAYAGNAGGCHQVLQKGAAVCEGVEEDQQGGARVGGSASGELHGVISSGDVRMGSALSTTLRSRSVSGNQVQALEVEGGKVAEGGAAVDGDVVEEGGEGEGRDSGSESSGLSSDCEHEEVAAEMDVGGPHVDVEAQQTAGKPRIDWRRHWGLFIGICMSLFGMVRACCSSKHVCHLALLWKKPTTFNVLSVRVCVCVRGSLWYSCPHCTLELQVL